ncbi:hypothetical protein F4604DRAFT_1708388 [Suillus subluteus]|nr:hypothetical protein F4604DRAFT_1708388 [Suillus subluteus]
MVTLTILIILFRAPDLLVPTRSATPRRTGDLRQDSELFLWEASDCCDQLRLLHIQIHDIAGSTKHYGIEDMRKML